MSGQAVTEFALIFPVLVLALVAIFDLGRAVFAWSTIGDAARTAGRVAIVDQDTTTIQNAAIAQAVGLALTSSDVAVTFPRLAPDGSIFAICNPVTTDGCIAQVVVSYDFNPATPIIGNIVGTIHMSSTTRMPVEHTSP